MSEPAAPHTQYVAAAVIERDGRVLVARRTRPADLAGLWEFPGGKVEETEAPEDALVRELREELGADISIIGVLAVSRGTMNLGEKGVRPFALEGYLCSLKGTSAEPAPVAADGTHDAVRWVTATELIALAREGAMPPADVPLAEAWI